MTQTEELQPTSSVKLPLAGGSTLNLQELQIHGASDKQEVTYLFPDIIALDSICQGEKLQYDLDTIRGFEIYIVEQWACERKYGTVLTSFTGDNEHEIKVAKIKLPLDTSKWSIKVNHFFQEIADYGAKPKLTEKGFLFITNLSSFPSNLNLLPISCGCILDAWEFFKVNVDLRRMTCGGRSALLLAEPSDASGAKFRQIYKTHPKVDIMYAVKELVSLVQICLVDFKLLDPNFVDGLLCDKTIEKIDDWWKMFGSAYYGTTPKDGLLGPSTVSAILGFVLSCHFRLDIAGSDFPKEPFNYFGFRVNVGKFQKQYNLKRTWYLDPITVEKLFRVTTKISNSDISKLKKVVKSTVQDISGKGSSIQYAPEVLTLDLDKLLKYFNCSARLNYLWNGKGDVRDLKVLDHHERQLYSSVTAASSALQTSSLRTGVDKIRNLPRRLQDENTPERKSKDRYRESSQDLQCSIIDSNSRESCTRITKTLNKKRNLTENQIFQCELKRRASLPMICNDINIDQIEYGNLPIDRNLKVDNENTLKRTKSFSFVENSINQWETLPSANNMGQKMKTLKKKLYLHESSTDLFNKSKEGYSVTIDKARNEANRCAQLIKPINRSYELQWQSDLRSRLKMEDIQVLSARLEYEIRVLSTRIRDTEESVDNFVSKVEALEKSVNQSRPCIAMRAKHLQNDNKQNNNSKVEYCWYNLTSRFDIERLQSLWMKIDPSFGYANWIRGWFISPEQEVVNQEFSKDQKEKESELKKFDDNNNNNKRDKFSNEKVKQT
ncbi:hypothetical protein BN7_3634 [Wickerhamomyces ciferrii]|uniref:STB6-like N-terminal domain-containing protein n=1 Tax=Wickerhamomyces ciferrii (strain ATCC 14091 / BCRC 22168 / CBS 111 / JCM 3599 / NBRC 0793 / NRRL Y-1031 F-60-10) TaxID=1206466 RepID=K0KFZ1_WICCF|nr:uncharacterized protein BN7_3634 [Wickerhamomyces ciferrii]CCH44075.1 hypothetical protein BN7_3634 [Wickerhamomyces ciferrii]